MPKVSVRAIPRTFDVSVIGSTSREEVSTYTFAIATDPFTETNFIGGNVVASDSSDTHEPFVGDSPNGGEPKLLREVNVAGAAELARTATVFFAGTGQASENQFLGICFIPSCEPDELRPCVEENYLR